jgi:hypothetical protein
MRDHRRGGRVDAHARPDNQQGGEKGADFHCKPPTGVGRAVPQSGDGTCRPHLDGPQYPPFPEGLQERSATIRNGSPFSG